MARPLSATEAETFAYHGEVRTDGRGYATVRLPAGADPLEPPLAHELQDLDPRSRARVTAQLEDGRFAIETDEPHVKVAWRITGRRARGEPRHRQQEEG
jgi:hypothetical protein